MLSLWRLTLLCGLFISPSCCLLDSLNPVLGNVQSTLQKETQVVTDKLQGESTGVTVNGTVIGQDVTDELAKLKLTPIGATLNKALGNVGDLVGTSLSTVVLKLEKLLGIKVLDSEVLKIKAELSSNGKSINLRVPVSATVALKLNPLFSDLVKVKVNLDVLVQASVGVDANTGVSVVLLGDCSSDSATVSISLLDGLGCIGKLTLNGLDGLLKKLLPLKVEAQVCPVIKNLTKLLDASIINELAIQLQSAANVDISVNSLS